MANSTGAFGAPPPDAPREVSQPLKTELIQEQIARARANEKTLAPFNPGPSKPVAPAVPSGKFPRSPMQKVVQAVGDFFGGAEPEAPPSTAVVPVIAAESEPALVVHEPLPGPLDPVPHQPAASNTDTPSRGIPRPITDPGKVITGGFGSLGDATYFPLDGSELRTLVEQMLINIAERLQDDLRFTMAITYPRVRARVEVIVEGYGDDGQDMKIPRVMPPHEKTPIEIARLHGDEIVFVVVAEHVEMTADGQSVTPPNKARIELGLDVPQKQAFEVPGGRMLADVTR